MARIAWNKGKTKATDERLKKAGETFSNKLKEGKIIHSQSGKPHSEKYKKRLSEIVNEKIDEGNWHLSFSKSRTKEYKGIKFLGSWEVKFAEWLDKNEIKWERVKISFKYQFKDKIKRYTPDFYLPEYDTYIEVKGYPTEKDFAKWEQFPKTLAILSGPLLQQIGLDIEIKKLDVTYKNVSWK